MSKEDIRELAEYNAIYEFNKFKKIYGNYTDEYVRHFYNKLAELRGGIDDVHACNCQHNSNSRDNEPCCRCDSRQTNAYMGKKANVGKNLKQLADLKEEYKDKQQAILRLEQYIDKLEKEGAVIDSVSGGNGGEQHFKIEGFPYPIYTEKKSQLLLRKIKLQELEEKIRQQIAVAEEFINSEPNSRIRRLLTYRYIDELTWVQIAHRMGKNHTADSCQKALERYLKKL